VPGSSNDNGGIEKLLSVVSTQRDETLICVKNSRILLMVIVVKSEIFVTSQDSSRLQFILTRNFMLTYNSFRTTLTEFYTMS
jgi:hypothetical protein